MSQLLNTLDDRNEKTLLNKFLTIPDFPSHIDKTKNHGVLKALTMIQFHHTILNLTKTKPLTNWQVITSMRLNLNMNMTPIFNFKIQFQILNLY